MSVSDPVRELRPELRKIADMVRAAFPAAVPEEAYLPLLALLLKGMSFRTPATVGSYCTGKPYGRVYNDVLGLESPGVPPASESPAYAVTAEALRRHGYDEWLAKSESELTSGGE